MQELQNIADAQAQNEQPKYTIRIAQGVFNGYNKNSAKDHGIPHGWAKKNGHAVYLVKREDGFNYQGSTTDFSNRMSTHRGGVGRAFEGAAEGTKYTIIAWVYDEPQTRSFLEQQETAIQQVFALTGKQLSKPMTNKDANWSSRREPVGLYLERKQGERKYYSRKDCSMLKCNLKQAIEGRGVSRIDTLLNRWKSLEEDYTGVSDKNLDWLDNWGWDMDELRNKAERLGLVTCVLRDELGVCVEWRNVEK